MSYYRIFGFSRASRQFLFAALPGTILSVAATCVVLQYQVSEFAQFRLWLSLALSLMIATAATGLFLALQGWRRKDDSPHLGRWCSGVHLALLFACGASFFLLTRKGAELSALSAGFSSTQGRGIVLKGREMPYQFTLPAPWQEMPARDGSEYMATNGEGVVLSIAADPFSLDSALVALRSIEACKKLLEPASVLGMREVAIEGRTWLRAEVGGEEAGIPQLMIGYFYGGPEGACAVTFLMPGNLRNQMTQPLDKLVSGFQLAPVPRKTGLPLLAEADSLLEENKSRQAFALIHEAPLSGKNEEILAWLTGHRRTLDAAFEFESARRFAEISPLPALWYWMRGRLLAEFDVRRCLAPDLTGAADRLEADICPELPALARKHPRMIEEIAKVMLTEENANRFLTGTPYWLPGYSETLRKSEEDNVRRGAKFRYEPWMTPEERWPVLRREVLEDFRKRYGAPPSA